MLCWLGIKVGAESNQGEVRPVTLWWAGFVVTVGAMNYFFVHRQIKHVHLAK